MVGGKEGFVMMGVCTHLGCVPSAMGDFGVVEGNAKSGGWFCPCHGSQYDTAGEFASGTGKSVCPKYEYLTDTRILIG